MNVFDYMNLVSGYVISKLENKKDFNESIEFLIKPVRDSYTKDLFYEVSENVNDKKQNFYLKFPCSNKDEFYMSVKDLLIEYIKNSDLLIYSATNNDIFYKRFSLVTKNRASVSFLMEDETDLLVFEKFKEYLDIKIKNKVESDETVEEDREELVEEKEEVATLSKIML